VLAHLGLVVAFVVDAVLIALTTASELVVIKLHS
jgi:hypothetical protein